MKKPQLVIIFIFLAFSSKAQDILFYGSNQQSSQYSLTQWSNSESNIKLGFHYRNQWGKALNSHGFDAFEVYGRKYFDINNYDKIAFELKLLSENVGKIYQQQNALLSAFSYRKPLGDIKSSKLIILKFGTQAGFYQRSTQNKGLWYGSQFNIPTQTIDYSSPSNEPTSNPNEVLSLTNLDINWAVGLDFKLDNLTLETELNGYHENNPSFLIKDSPTKLGRRTNFIANIIWTTNTKMSLGIRNTASIHNAFKTILISPFFNFNFRDLSEDSFIELSPTFMLVSPSNSLTKLTKLGIETTIHYGNLSTSILFEMPFTGVKDIQNKYNGFELKFEYNL